jgi:hypothetical protein
MCLRRAPEKYIAGAALDRAALHREDVWGSERAALHTFNSFRLRPLYLRGRAQNAHWLIGWVGPRVVWRSDRTAIPRPSSQSMYTLLSRLLRGMGDCPSCVQFRMAWALCYTEPICLVENWAPPWFHMREISGSNLGPRGIVVYPPSPGKLRHRTFNYVTSSFRIFSNSLFTKIPTVLYCSVDVLTAA